MKAPADKSHEPQRQAAAHEAPQQQDRSDAELQFIDNRAETTSLRQLQEAVDNSPRQVAQRQQHSRVQNAHMELQTGSDNVSVQRVEDEEVLQGGFDSESPAQLAQPSEAKPNNIGLPDNLKAGVESLSGLSLDNVKVHYNSSEPAQLNAHAYAQGADIHVGPGQEQHLPHEAWHVVQQAQGRVKPTVQMKDGVGVNDDRGLESEADLMGGKAAVQQSSASIYTDPNSFIGFGLEKEADKMGAKASNSTLPGVAPPPSTNDSNGSIPVEMHLSLEASGTTNKVVQGKIIKDTLNLVGEIHSVYDNVEGLRDKEEQHYTGKGMKYWREGMFKFKKTMGDDPTLIAKYRLKLLLENLESGPPPELDKQDAYFQKLINDQDDLLAKLERLKEVNLPEEQKQSTILALKSLRAKIEIASLSKQAVNGAAVTALSKPMADIVGELTSQQLSKERSEHMHDVANSAVGSESGVWKIGDDHREDLKDKNDKKYELTAMEDVDKDPLGFKVTGGVEVWGKDLPPPIAPHVWKLNDRVKWTGSLCPDFYDTVENAKGYDDLNYQADQSGKLEPFEIEGKKILEQVGFIDALDNNKIIVKYDGSEYSEFPSEVWALLSPMVVEAAN